MTEEQKKFIALKNCQRKFINGKPTIHCEIESDFREEVKPEVNYEERI